MKSFTFATLLAALILQFGCSQAPPPAAPDTRAADEKAIRDGESAWVRDFATKDPEKVLAHYSDDADSMLPEMALMTGHESIRAGLKEEFSDPNSSLDFRPAKVVIAKSGELAYSEGTYDYDSTDPKTKKAVHEHGNYVEVYKKQTDGSWKAAEDIATQEAPPAPMNISK
jgi:ketosteroid isomerase-like protein